MSKNLWIGRRFQRDPSGNYTVTGDCGAEKVCVVIDLSVVRGLTGPDAERMLLHAHPRIQAAARQSWLAGSTSPRFHPYSKRMQHHEIVLTAEDLQLDFPLPRKFVELSEQGPPLEPQRPVPKADPDWMDD